MPLPLKAAARLGVELRPAVDDDVAFIEALYASTRAGELAQTGWPAETQRAFLSQQHRMQERHYRIHYPDAEWLIVERGGESIGRLYLVDGEDRLHLIDISLTPSARGAGLGSAILGDLIDAAAAADKPVSIHVELHNPARRLYERLGFGYVAEKGLYLEMEWRAA